MPITPLTLEEANERLREEVKDLLRTVHSLSKHIEYRIDKLPNKKLEDNLAFLTALGEEGWIIVDRNGRNAVFAREKRNA